MKRILITTGIFPPDIGGPASYAEALANHLNSQKIEVCVLTYSKQFRTGKLYSKYPFKVIRVWGKWPIWIKHFIFGAKLLGLARACDTIYALNVWSAGFPSFIASRIYGKKFIIKVAGDYAWEVGVGKNKVSLLINDFQRSKKKGWIGVLYKLQGMVCRKADAVIVPSKYLAGIVAGWGVPESKIKVIYNGADFKSSDLSKEEARNKIGIHGNIILSVGRLMPWKGFRMLIKIMPQLLELGQFTRLVIVGDGPDKKTLELMIKNMGLDKKVFIVGKKSKDELAVYLASADIFILNSGYEGFSHQILEAMICGVPVIASVAGGNKEVITQGENGFLVRYNDEFNIIEAIKTIWREPGLKGELAAAGKKTVQKFSSDKMFEETIKILNS
ncbi:MAG: glycosyltransferase family 4 protein [Patescibacteria group bacterium]